MHSAKRTIKWEYYTQSCVPPYEEPDYPDRPPARSLGERRLDEVGTNTKHLQFPVPQVAARASRSRPSTGRGTDETRKCKTKKFKAGKNSNPARNAETSTNNPRRKKPKPQKPQKNGPLTVALQVAVCSTVSPWMVYACVGSLKHDPIKEQPVQVLEANEDSRWSMSVEELRRREGDGWRIQADVN